MAKAKPTSNSNAKVKKVVSTKGIFKHAKPRQWYRENVNLREDGTQRATASIENSRDHLQARAEEAIDFTCQELTQLVVSSDIQFQQRLQNLKALDSTLQKSLGQDELEFVSNDGKLTGRQPLGDRIERFKQIIAEEEKTIEMLGKQWDEVNQQILSLASEVVGPNGTVNLLQGSLDGALGFISPQQNGITEELEKEKHHWETEMARVNKEALENLKASEEEMNNQQKKQLADLLAMMAAEV